MILGSIVALITPFLADTSIDFVSLKKLIEWHIANGTDCIGIAGTTGESPTLSISEQLELFEFTVNTVAGRVPVMAGCGANSTKEAIELAKGALRAGANCQLQVAPYYNKPTQEGLFQHFARIAGEIDLPVVLYNVPGRTVTDLQNETVLRLAKIPGIVGIKDATGDLNRGQWLIKELPYEFAVYSGDDPTALPLIYCGAKGCVSVTANIVPHWMKKLCGYALAGNIEEANQLQQKLMPLHQAVLLEVNPVSAKWILSKMGLCSNTLRLPLVPLSEMNQSKLVHILQEYPTLLASSQ